MVPTLNTYVKCKSLSNTIENFSNKVVLTHKTEEKSNEFRVQVSISNWFDTAAALPIKHAYVEALLGSSHNIALTLLALVPPYYQSCNKDSSKFMAPPRHDRFLLSGIRFIDLLFIMNSFSSTQPLHLPS